MPTLVSVTAQSKLYLATNLGWVAYGYTSNCTLKIWAW